MSFAFFSSSCRKLKDVWCGVLFVFVLLPWTNWEENNAFFHSTQTHTQESVYLCQTERPSEIYWCVEISCHNGISFAYVRRTCFILISTYSRKWSRGKKKQYHKHKYGPKRMVEAQLRHVISAADWESNCELLPTNESFFSNECGWKCTESILLS